MCPVLSIFAKFYLSHMSNAHSDLHNALAQPHRSMGKYKKFTGQIAKTKTECHHPENAQAVKCSRVFDVPRTFSENFFGL